VLVGMLGGDPTQSSQVLRSCPEPQIVYHYLKHLWTSGSRSSALTQLRTFTTDLPSTNKRLAARAHHRIGQWLLEMDSAEQQQTKTGVAPRNLKNILGTFRKATELEPNWYKTWHAYALTNFEAVSVFHRAGQTVAAKPYLLPAVQGFFRSIALGPKQSLQDTLRLLTLWFQYGSERAVEQALRAGFTDLSVDTWLQVIPQIIARIHSSSLPVRRLVTELLSTVGSAHPQALVYPLVVAAKSESSAAGVGNELLSRLREHSPKLIEQTLLVADELIRVSIIWHEQWHGALEEASRTYFTEKNVDGMLSRLAPLYQETLARGPTTLREVEFVQAHGRDLEEAFEWCEKFASTRDPADINQAWDLFYQVFRTVNNQLPNLTKLDLQYVSPALQVARDLELAVPGTYTANAGRLVRIRRFDPLLSVIKSKQRPRKLSMFGDDGVAYAFLLKGHEDLRQDERVMQLFGLVNTLLAQDQETVRLPPIVRYAAIPLSPNSGVISWVPNCHTLNELVRKFRDQRKIELRSEHRCLLQLATNTASYDTMPLINKVELFQSACAITDGNDLAHILWQRSPNSEVWLKRRTSYTRSLSVMSMVGYILGLGDRHPSNIMLERTHGKIFHIDFGDCFGMCTCVSSLSLSLSLSCAFLSRVCVFSLSRVCVCVCVSLSISCVCMLLNFVRERESQRIVLRETEAIMFPCVRCSCFFRCGGCVRVCLPLT
jgi:serine/threonine-protein kinase mTOR